jgi:hypothetical protein
MSSPISKRPEYIKDYIRLYKYMADFHKDPENAEVIEAIQKKENDIKKKDKRRVYDREYKRKSRSTKKAPGPTKLVIETGTFELSFD